MVRVEVANDGLGYIFQEITWVPSLYHFSYDASFLHFPFPFNFSTSSTEFYIWCRNFPPPPALVPLTNKIICSVAGL